MKKIVSTFIVIAMLLSVLPFAMLTASAESGSCGANVTWSYANGTLTISGSGDMANYTGLDTPWYNAKVYRDITKVVVKSGVTNIGNYAFYFCSNLTSISLPNTITSIGRNAFVQCVNLTSIVIPEGVTSLGDFVFRSCEALKSVSVPTTLKSYGQNVFDGCVNLQKYYFAEGTKEIPYGTFDGCTDLEEVYVPASVTKVGSYAFADCTSMARMYFGGTKEQFLSINWYSTLVDDIGTATVYYNSTRPEDSFSDNSGSSDNNGSQNVSGVGDINGSGDIDSMDYVLLKRAYFGTYTLSNVSIGDINGSGDIDSMDYVLLKRAYFGTYTIGGGATEEPDQPPVTQLTSYEKVVKYIKSNGKLSDDSERYVDYILNENSYFRITVNSEGVLEFAMMSLTTSTSSLYTLKVVEGNYLHEGSTYMEMGSYSELITYEISAASFSQYNDYLYNYVYYGDYPSAESSTRDTIGLGVHCMLMYVDQMINNMGIGVSLYDLGFTNY